RQRRGRPELAGAPAADERGLVPGLRHVLVHQGRRLRPLPDVRPQHVLKTRRPTLRTTTKAGLPTEARFSVSSSSLRFVVLPCRLALPFCFVVSLRAFSGALGACSFRLVLSVALYPACSSFRRPPALRAHVGDGIDFDARVPRQPRHLNRNPRRRG